MNQILTKMIDYNLQIHTHLTSWLPTEIRKDVRGFAETVADGQKAFVAKVCEHLKILKNLIEKNPA